MRPELSALKKEMEESGINKYCYAIDEAGEGYCIYDARSVIEVDVSERGNRYDLQTFTDVNAAIKRFKEMVFSDTVLNKK
ncbi:hypothetical protein [Aliiglaciecola sp. M165]|uniref:hypothetical protein n=1 Tax=Aliiglaciecola sp. M165 TaxID=2593649 RepID=UPI00117D7D6E|nr:hypothetical protein [Aliiglaciecola sp. M165]TRY28751.1 hypothetical protein FM019_20505 [Aliiglaciecola sp. M165]